MELKNYKIRKVKHVQKAAADVPSLSQENMNTLHLFSFFC